MKKYFIIIISLVSFQLCKADNCETKVIIDIFDNLIEQMGALSVFDVPLPPEILFTNNTIGYDTVEYKKTIDEIKKKNDRIRGTPFVIAVFDTLFNCYNLNLNVEYIRSQLIEPEYIEALNTINDSLVINQPLNLSEIDNRKRVVLRYYSEFPNDSKIWKRENYDFLFSGVLKISKIYFNNKTDFGLFYCSYTCGPLCGEEAIICVRKIKEQWRIEKKILLSVS